MLRLTEEDYHTKTNIESKIDVKIEDKDFIIMSRESLGGFKTFLIHPFTDECPFLTFINKSSSNSKLEEFIISNRINIVAIKTPSFIESIMLSTEMPKDGYIYPKDYYSKEENSVDRPFRNYNVTPTRTYTVTQDRPIRASSTDRAEDVNNTNRPGFRGYRNREDQGRRTINNRLIR